MATLNAFDLLCDADAEDISLLAASAAKRAQPPTDALPTPDKLPSKPFTPSQAVRAAKNEANNGRGRGHGYSRTRRGGFAEDFNGQENSFSNFRAIDGQNALENGDAQRPFERRGGGFNGPRSRGGFGGSRRFESYNNGELGEGDHQLRSFENGDANGPFERRGGSGGFRAPDRGGFSNGEYRDGEHPRQGFGRSNGTAGRFEIRREDGSETQNDLVHKVTEDIVNEANKNLGDANSADKKDKVDGDKKFADGTGEKEPEEKKMTLEEYEKVLEEKRKALQSLKTTEERKVDAKEFESMQQLSNKKANVDVFIKLGSDKDKRKELSEKDEKARKSVSINEFLKPAEGERFYYLRGRGGSRGGFGGRDRMNYAVSASPSIEDLKHFPTLVAK